MNHLQFGSTVGTIGITWNAQRQLTRIDWYLNHSQFADEGELDERCALVPGELRSLVEVVRSYLGEGLPLGPIPWSRIDMTGWSEFQRHVYETIATIPHGETRTYAWVAGKVAWRTRKQAAPRAVGQALRRNPLPILIPCHRVVGAQAIGGFMGVSDPDQPELVLKNRLIEIENSYINPLFSFCREYSREKAAS